jgi:hypothetical protein
LLKRSANNNRRLKKRVSAVDSTPQYSAQWRASASVGKTHSNTASAETAMSKSVGAGIFR